ncbi:MAG: hypothetical protein K0S71_903 [Clostridia bacterium]|jgi:hypothetical protein|nr:hypothetical protein [Clostridia bacterium]
MVEVKLVTLDEPCSACIIITNLIKEMFKELEAQMPEVAFTIIEMQHIKELKAIKGVEVEKMPIILIQDEQISAGSLPNKRYLKQLIEEEIG